MSGHSKWSTIKHKKGANDAKRGKIFTRHAKLIEIAAHEGGNGDPSMNTALKVAIENAKMDNVPNANIERAIKKGTGELKGDVTVGVIYECYAPGGTACIIECLTDNKNRSLSNVKSTIEKRGGKWAESGSVMFLFDRKGIIRAEGTMTDSLELELMDAGLEDITIENKDITITTAANHWNKVRDVLQVHKITVTEAGLKYIPHVHVDIKDIETAQKLMQFIEAIEEDDDVSEVHSNADISEDIASQL